MMTRPLKRQVFYFFSIIILLPILLVLLLNARTKSATATVKSPYSEERFIKKIAPRAQELGVAYGVNPSIIIAQAALDSNYGKTILAAKYNNLFKLTVNTGQEQVKLKDTNSEKVAYACYDSWDDCLDDYLYRLQNDESLKTLYENLVASATIDIAADQFKETGYTDDNTYDSQLLQIIETYQLTQYDRTE